MGRPLRRTRNSGVVLPLIYWILYPMEFDADQLLGPPYHCAPFALIGDQKCKLRRDRADYLKRRSSLGLVANETSDCVPTELDASGLHEATPVQ